MFYHRLHYLPSPQYLKQISKWQPGLRIGDTPMNSISTSHCYCCQSRGNEGPRQGIPGGIPFYQGSPGCHEKDPAAAPLGDKQGNTVAAAHRLLGGKGAILHDQKSPLMGSQHFSINSRLLSISQAGQSNVEQNHWLFEMYTAPITPLAVWGMAPLILKPQRNVTSSQALY